MPPDPFNVDQTAPILKLERDFDQTIWAMIINPVEPYIYWVGPGFTDIVQGQGVRSEYLRFYLNQKNFNPELRRNS